MHSPGVRRLPQGSGWGLRPPTHGLTCNYVGRPSLSTEDAAVSPGSAQYFCDLEVFEHARPWPLFLFVSSQHRLLSQTRAQPWRQVTRADSSVAPKRLRYQHSIPRAFTSATSVSRRSPFFIFRVDLCLVVLGDSLLQQQRKHRKES